MKSSVVDDKSADGEIRHSLVAGTSEDKSLTVFVAAMIVQDSLPRREVQATLVIHGTY